MQKKTAHKANLSPQAAKILEQYRNAGKPVGEAETANPDGTAPAASKPAPPAPPPAARIPRSGTRGK